MASHALGKLERNLYDNIYDSPCGDMHLLTQCHQYIHVHPNHKNLVIKCLESFDKISVASIIDNYDYESNDYEQDPNYVIF